MLCPLPAGQRRARSGLSRSALSTFRDINCRNARLCAARASKTSGSTSSRFPARRASNNAIERRYRAPVPLNPIGDNLSDVAACTRAQKGPAQRQCGSFPPALRTGGGRNEARSSRARDSERAVAAHGDGIGAKQGGILKIGNFDSPASMSMLEESTLATNRPIMGVFNNLVMFRHCQPCPAFNLALSFPTAHARRTAGATASIQPRRASR